MTPCFIMTVSAAYLRMAIVNLERLAKLYPNSRILIYDYGLTEQQKENIGDQYPNAEIVPWEVHFYDTPNRTWRLPPEEALRRVRDYVTRFPRWRKKSAKFILKKFPGSKWARRFFEQYDEWENFVMQKVACIKDASKKCGPEPMVFLDADAIIFRRLDVLENIKFDIGLTVMHPDSQNFSPDKCNGINTGVIVFGANEAARVAFLENWWAKCLSSAHRFAEQPGLVCLLEETAAGLFRTADGKTIIPENVSETAIAGDVKINIQTLPCGRYNHILKEEVSKLDISSVDIVHFVHNRQQAKIFDNAVAELSRRYDGRTAVA